MRKKKSKTTLPGSTEKDSSTDLVGWQYEEANICAECRGSLRAPDGHYHSRMALYAYGAEPICCKCCKCKYKENS